MDPKLFLKHTIADRIRLMIEDKNLDYIYCLFEKHLRISMDELKKRFKIEFNHIRQLVDIEGSTSDIYLLFNYMIGYDVKVDSIQSTHIRLQLNALFTKLK